MPVTYPRSLANAMIVVLLIAVNIVARQSYSQNRVLDFACFISAGLSQQWIQWYFKSMLENGVIGMCLRLPCFTTTFTQSGHHLECSDAIMETDINMPTHDIVKV